MSKKQVTDLSSKTENDIVILRAQMVPIVGKHSHSWKNGRCSHMVSDDCSAVEETVKKDYEL